VEEFQLFSYSTHAGRMSERENEREKHYRLWRSKIFEKMSEYAGKVIFDRNQ
jgi:hypothetical protein